MSSPASGTPTDRPTNIPFVVKLAATGFFVGYIPWASGTFGSLVGILLYLIPGAESPWTLGMMITFGFVLGFVTADVVARAEGDKLTRSASLTKSLFQKGSTHAPDPSIVVIDEIVGMWISLLWLPKTLPAIVIAFVAFRIFDILKPAPARTVERLPSGLGIMMDDVVAGIYANVATVVILLLLTQILHIIP